MESDDESPLKHKIYVSTEYIAKVEQTIPRIPEPKGECKLLVEGKEYYFPILHGNDGCKFLDLRTLFLESGHLVFDPGFMATALCCSSITLTDGEKGLLKYRGYAIEDLAENCDYIEVCYLLLYGILPNKNELDRFSEIVNKEMMVHELMISFFKGFKSDAHPMAIMTGVVGALSAFMHSEINVLDPRDREYAAIKLVAKIPTLAAISYRTYKGLPIVYPKEKYGYIKNFLYMMFHNVMKDNFEINEKLIQAVNLFFILHADHEQCASTTTVRIAGSSLANPYACISSGIASLWGPAHGGANEEVLKMLQELKSKKNIPTLLEEVKAKKKKLMGFGHRIYKNYDPRAKILRKICLEIIGAIDNHEDRKIIKLAFALEDAALKDDYFVKRKLFPNVDFFSGLILKGIGIPVSMFTVMFAVARSIGWICQWREMMSESNFKIERPRQLYVGEVDKPFIPIEKREKLQFTTLIDPVLLNRNTSLYKP